MKSFVHNPTTSYMRGSYKIETSTLNNNTFFTTTTPLDHRSKIRTTSTTSKNFKSARHEMSLACKYYDCGTPSTTYHPEKEFYLETTEH